jgi:methyl-accepting chemotaxis protein
MGTIVNMPKLSIAGKFYAIFASMATTTIALSVVAVQSARHHAALTGDFESTNEGSWNVERVNSLIYAMMMETRGIYLAQDRRQPITWMRCSRSTTSSI